MVPPPAFGRQVVAHALVLALLVTEAIVVFRVTSWAYAQPSSMDTQTPAVHWLSVLAPVALLVGVGLGLLLGVTAGWPGRSAVLAIAGVMAVAFFSSAVASDAQPCIGPQCDIAGAPAAIMTLVIVTVAMLPTLAGGYVLGVVVLAGRRHLARGATV